MPQVATRGRRALDVRLGCMNASELGAGGGHCGQKRLDTGWRLLGFLRTLSRGYSEPTSQVRRLRPEKWTPPTLALTM